MKPPIRFLLAAIFLGSLSACMKKEEDSPDLTNDMVRISTFSAQIDTTQWTAQEAAYAVEGNRLLVSGNRTTDTVESGMALVIENYTGRGTYNLDSNLNPAALSYKNVLYKAKSGQLTVSQDDSDRLSGNFTMTATSTYGNVLISDGKFTYYKRK